MIPCRDQILRDDFTQEDVLEMKAEIARLQHCHICKPDIGLREGHDESGVPLVTLPAGDLSELNHEIASLKASLECQYAQVEGANAEIVRLREALSRAVCYLSSPLRADILASVALEPVEEGG